MADDKLDPRGVRVEVNPLQAEALLKQIMTKVWTESSGQLSVETCVDEAFRIAKERYGLQTPREWRDRFVRAAQKVLDARAHAPAPQVEVALSDESPEEFEKRVRQASHHAVPVVVKKGDKS